MPRPSIAGRILAELVREGLPHAFQFQLGLQLDLPEGRSSVLNQQGDEQGHDHEQEQERTQSESSHGVTPNMTACIPPRRRF
jgi:hypothetical protein